jgi:hypothetical protein
MGGEPASPAAPPIPVRSGRRSWWAYSVYILFALGVAVLLAAVIVVVRAPGLFAVDLPGALLAIAAFLIGLAVLDRFPRQILVTPSTIEFRYLLSRISLRWDQLAAPTLVGKGLVAFRAVTGAKGVWGSLTVTVDQARAILKYPACPTFPLSEALAKAIRAD